MVCNFFDGFEKILFNTKQNSAILKRRLRLDTKEKLFILFDLENDTSFCSDVSDINFLETVRT